MEFQRERVYTAVNADELRAGDKVIAANCLADLMGAVEKNIPYDELAEVRGADYEKRFILGIGNLSYALAYLVERKENCTNCQDHEYCGFVQNQSRFANLNRCENWKPKTEQKAEKKEMCLNCKHYNKVNDFRDCTLVDNPTCACPHYEAELHYRPFKDTDELIKVWGSLCNEGKGYILNSLDMPHIWVREKGCDKSADLITCYGSKGITVRGKGMYFDTLFTMFEFLDGSPCGVEE